MFKTGNKISVIENLGATQDGFDTLGEAKGSNKKLKFFQTTDLSDNEIQKLENFPLLRRLRTLFLHNNHISSVAPKLGESLPKLESLFLTNNKFETLVDLNPLRELSSLKMLSLVNNPVTKLKNYRVYVVHLLPQLRVLDYLKVKVSVTLLCSFLTFLYVNPIDFKRKRGRLGQCFAKKAKMPRVPVRPHSHQENQWQPRGHLLRMQ